MAPFRAMASQEDLIGTAEAARRLGKSHRTIHRLVETGELHPALTAPGGAHGVFLFDPDDIDALIGEQDKASA